jgi:glycosyltransferase involved in cell wall biosynthesis
MMPMPKLRPANTRRVHPTHHRYGLAPSYEGAPPIGNQTVGGAIGGGANAEGALTRLAVPRHGLPLAITVIVPSYRRPEELKRCLAAIDCQTRRADEVVVVLREEDDPSRKVVAATGCNVPVRIVSVREPGVVAALNTGLRSSRGDVVVFTDDDAAPRPDWLERMVARYQEDPCVGGVGGRDVIEGNCENEVDSSRVGRLQWFGRCVGNHHLGAGAAHEVDVLKGVNMSFCREALAGRSFDVSLRGSGTIEHWELGMCLALRRAGWRLLYDPAMVVDHRLASRRPGDERLPITLTASLNRAYNETRALVRYLPGYRRAAFIAWALLIGSRSSPGLLQLARPARPSVSVVVGAMRGRTEAIAGWLRERG